MGLTGSGTGAVRVGGGTSAFGATLMTAGGDGSGLGSGLLATGCGSLRSLGNFIGRGLGAGRGFITDCGLTGSGSDKDSGLGGGTGGGGKIATSSVTGFTNCWK
jgi:hypothetical protein